MREDIKAYIDGELSPERMQEVRRALESDPALMEEYTAMKNITGMLQSLTRQPQVKGVEKTRAAVAPPRRFRWREAIAVAATLGVLAIFAAPAFMQAKVSTKTAFRGQEAESMPAMSAENADMPQRDRAMADDLAGNALGGYTLKDKREGEVPQVRGNDERMASMMSPGSTGAAGEMALRDSAIGNMAEETKNTVDPRLVIKSASFTVQVKNVQEAMDQATQLARTLKGYIESSTVDAPYKDKPAKNGYLTIRVPQSGFESAVEQIRKYGRIRSESTSGDDVTAQVTDIAARMNTLKAEEDSLRTLLRGATKMGDILDIKDRISQVRQQIESYDSQQRVLKTLASLSTISLTLTADEDDLEPIPTDDDWFEDTKESAIGMLTGIGRFIAQAATFVFILSPVWLPVLLFLLWFKKRAFTTPAREA